MAAERIERRLAAVLAADMVGYSRLMEVDEAGTIARQRAHRVELVDPTLASFGGRIVKTTGDGMLVEFASVVSAVECAAAIQQAMPGREADRPDAERIRYRIGINVGDIVIDGDDILGDGVNVAARLEGLAGPGGIAISGAVFDQTQGKISIAFSDGGRHEVKNLNRPVHVWHWIGAEPDSGKRTAPAATGESGASLRRLLSSIVQPTIAVIPFQNMSRDPDFDYFCDGLTESLITDLSRSSRLAVASRQSSFSLKGQVLDAKALARALEARFLIEGSVQVMGTRMRVNAQLIDAADDTHLWADRYDRSTEDLFAVQDEICEAIALGTDSVVAAGALARLRDQAAGRPEVRRLLNQAGVYIGRFDEESLVKCQQVAEQALAIEPESVGAQMYASVARTIRTLNGWTSEPEALSTALCIAEELIATDREPATTLGYFSRGYARLAAGAFEDAENDCRQALARMPEVSPMHTIYARVLCALGRFDEARRETIRALNLHPFPYPIILIILGLSALLVGQAEDAVAAFAKFKELRQRHTRENALLGAALAAAGREAEARAAVNEVLSGDPTLTARQVVGPYPFADPAHRDCLLALLCEAGLN